MVITKENSLFLLTGQRAASWLADQSCRIGLEPSKAYTQDAGNVVYKFSQTEIAVAGETLPSRLYAKWEDQHPSGTTAHFLTGKQKEMLLKTCENIDCRLS